jgi:hypothetical protein
LYDEERLEMLRDAWSRSSKDVGWWRQEVRGEKEDKGEPSYQGDRKELVVRGCEKKGAWGRLTLRLSRLIARKIGWRRRRSRTRKRQRMV